MTALKTTLVSALALAMLGGSAVPVHAQSMMKEDKMMAPTGAMAKGSFRKAEAPVSGSFQIKKEAGKQVLVLSSDFKTNDMAPDLKVIFSPSATPLASTKAPAFPLKAGSYTILASLKSAAGAQSYVIPASIDLSKQGSVLIWCKKFNATMAWAPLKP
ncbi:MULTISPECIES: DM13 domain-containing protein [unclassified Synechococcus]|uniref:DM13 domain-containing protein n=1 Tax=unclassified Synechococcus TaxID=2626047 RepID=UPI0020CDE23D|nr:MULTISPECIES: DM13 domain-containing protein [unclassified Synechococcus]